MTDPAVSQRRDSIQRRNSLRPRRRIFQQQPKKSHLQSFPTMQWMRRMRNVRRNQSEKLTPSFVRHATKIFRSLGQNPILSPLDKKGTDVDPHGVVTRVMLENAVNKHLGSDNPEAAALLSAMDLDKNAKIDFNEFVRALAKVQQKDYYKLDTQKSADKWQAVFTKLSLHANRQEIMEKIKIAKERRKNVSSVRSRSRLDKLDFDNLMDLFNASMSGSIFDIPSKREHEQKNDAKSRDHHNKRSLKASDAAVYQVNMVPPSSWGDSKQNPATNNVRQRRALHNVSRRQIQSQFSTPAIQTARKVHKNRLKTTAFQLKDPLRFSQSTIPVLSSTKRNQDIRRIARYDVSRVLASIKTPIKTRR